MAESDKVMAWINMLGSASFFVLFTAATAQMVVEAKSATDFAIMAALSSTALVVFLILLRLLPRR